MLQIKVDGVLARDAERKVSTKGNPMVIALVKSDQYVVRCTLMGDLLDRAAVLKRGDAVTVVGQMDVSEYERDGERKYSLNVLARKMLALEE